MTICLLIYEMIFTFQPSLIDRRLRIQHDWYIKNYIFLNELPLRKVNLQSKQAIYNINPNERFWTFIVEN